MSKISHYGAAALAQNTKPWGSVAPNRFIERLRERTGLADAQLARIEALCAEPRELPADHEVTREGLVPERVHILLDGWIARQKRFRDGNRQLTALLIPGDLCDPDALHVARLDHDLVTMSKCRVTTLPRDALLRLMGEDPAIGHALMWLALVDAAAVSRWVALLGRATARERIAHLFCEMFARLDAVGLVEGGGFRLPLTQEELSDVTGLTPVHVNRMLQALRADALIRLEGQRLAVPDRARLAREAQFSLEYLHLEGMRR